MKGDNNTVADALSRATVSDVSLGINFQEMAKDQQDAEVQAYRVLPSSLQVKDIPFGIDGVTLLCDISTGHSRPIVPTNWRRKVFDMFHSLSHPSIRTTRKLIANKFVWKGLKKQVGSWAKQCTACQAAKTHTHTKAPLGKFDVSHHRFDHINIDLVGSLPPSNGFTHLLLSTVFRGGQKPSPFMRLHPLPALRLWFQTGLLVSVYQ